MSGWLGCTTFSDLSSLSSFPNSSSKKGSWKGIRTLASPVPKPCSGCPTIPWENFSNLSVPVPFNTLSIFDNAIHSGSDSWMALSQIYKAERNPPARGSTKKYSICRPMAFVSYWSQTKIGLEVSMVFRLWPLFIQLENRICLAVHSTVPPARFFPLWKNLFRVYKKRFV